MVAQFTIPSELPIKSFPRQTWYQHPGRLYDLTVWQIVEWCAAQASRTWLKATWTGDWSKVDSMCYKLAVFDKVLELDDWTIFARSNERQIPTLNYNDWLSSVMEFARVADSLARQAFQGAEDQRPPLRDVLEFVAKQMPIHFRDGWSGRGQAPNSDPILPPGLPDKFALPGRPGFDELWTDNKPGETPLPYMYTPVTPPGCEPRPVLTRIDSPPSLDDDESDGDSVRSAPSPHLSSVGTTAAASQMVNTSESTPSSAVPPLPVRNPLDPVDPNAPASSNTGTSLETGGGKKVRSSGFKAAVHKITKRASDFSLRSKRVAHGEGAAVS